MNKRKGILALEGLDDPVTIDDSAFEFLYRDEGGNEQTGLVQLDDVEKIEEAEEDSQEVDQLIGVTLTMESLYSTLESTPTHTPFSRPAAQALNAALESMVARAKPLFADESLQGKQARRAAMDVALEDLGETIRLNVKKILAWIKRAAEVIFDHIEGIVRGANAVTEAAGRLQDLAARIRGEKGDEPPEDSAVTNRQLAHFFSDADGKVYDAHTIVEHYKSFCQDFNEAFSRDVAVGGSHYVANQINEVLKQSQVDTFTREVALDLSDKTIKHMIASNFKAFTPNESEGNLVYALPFGGMSFVVNVLEESGKRAGISFGTKVSETVAQEHLPVLKPSEVYEMMTVLESSMHRGIYRDYKQVKSALYSLKKTIAEMCDEITRQQRQTFAGTMPSLHFLKGITETMFTLVKDTYKYNGQATRSMIKYGHASLSKFQ